jgi:outer membrane protein assembly factor BamB
MKSGYFKLQPKRVVIWVVFLLFVLYSFGVMPIGNSLATQAYKVFFSNFNPTVLVREKHIQNLPIIHGKYVSWVDSRVNEKEGKILPYIYMKKLSTGVDKPAFSFARKSGARTQYRNFVIWAENTDRLREDNFDIKLFDWETGKLKYICKNKRMQNNPQISKEYIIWKDLRDSKRGSDDIWDFAIYGMSIESGEEFVVKEHDTPGTAELFDRYVALSIKEDGKKDSDIYLHLMSSAKKIPICIESGDQFNPKIIGDVVLWEDARNAPKYGYRKPTDIFGYSTSTHKELFISSNPKREYGLTTGGDRYALWYRDSEGMLGMFERTIHGYDAISSKSFDICTKPGDYRNAVVGKNWIVWEDHSNSIFGSDLMAYKISSGITYTLVKSFGDQRNPKIYAHNVVWEDHGGPESEKVSVWFANLEELSADAVEPTNWGYSEKLSWNQARANSRQNGLTNAEIRNLDYFPINEQWKIKLDGGINSTACFDRRGFGYIGTGNGYFYKFSAFTGEIIWKQRLDDGIRSSPAIYKDRVFVGTTTGKFYCLETTDGAEIWSIQTEGAIDASPTIFLSEVDHYPMVIFSSGDKTLHLYGVRGRTPNKRWELKLDGWVKGPMAVDYNPLQRSSQNEPVKKYIAVGLSSNYILYIDPSTSEIISKFETDSPMKTSPILTSSTCISSSNEGTLYCIDFNGWGRPPQLHFEEKTYHKSNSAPAFDSANKRIYYESKPGAISGYENELLWTMSLGQHLSSSPSISHYEGAASGLFLSSSIGIVVLINTTNGEVLWKTELEATITSSPSILDTGFVSIYLGTNDSYLYCWSQRPTNLDY